MRAAALGLAFVIGACGQPQRTPGGDAPSPAPRAEPRADCAPLRAVLAENDATPEDLRCEQRVDLDGDGRLDRAFISTSDGADVRLAVALGGQRAVFIGGAEAPLQRTEYKGDAQAAAVEPDFSWLVGWEPAKRDGARGVRSFDAPDALGDGLWMTGGDAAAVLYLARSGWVLMHLGY